MTMTDKTVTTDCTTIAEPMPAPITPHPARRATIYAREPYRA
jgi:hypothetical protein